MWNPLEDLYYWIVEKLEFLGLVDGERGRRTADLAWPRMLTGLARKSQQAADIAMLGYVLGPTAIAGLAFASIYWRGGRSMVSGLAGGTLTQVSQRYGARKFDAIDIAMKQSIWIGTLLVLPITAIYWVYPTELIAVFGADPQSVTYGSIYLQIIGLKLIPSHLNWLASRTLAGADDTWIPMVVRAIGAVLNIILNIILIFGLGLGVLGAALGTLLAEIAIISFFFYGFLFGGLPVIGRFPVHLTVTPPYFDFAVGRELLKISTPNMLRRISRQGGLFLLFTIIAAFGPAVVAAYEIARRVRGLMATPSWGFSMAASSLVGQQLGTGNESEAEAYGWDILRFSLVIYVLSVLFVFVFAEPITYIFVQEPDALAHATLFVRVGSISLIGMGIDRAMSGSLKGAGDTRWPMYGRIIGLYLFMVPAAYLGTVTPLGIIGLYLAMFLETAVPAVVTTYRFWSDKWKIVSRGYRPSLT